MAREPFFKTDLKLLNSPIVKSGELADLFFPPLQTSKEQIDRAATFKKGDQSIEQASCVMNELIEIIESVISPKISSELANNGLSK